MRSRNYVTISPDMMVIVVGAEEYTKVLKGLSQLEDLRGNLFLKIIRH
jgi:hypothetical protein